MLRYMKINLKIFEQMYENIELMDESIGQTPEGFDADEIWYMKQLRCEK